MKKKGYEIDIQFLNLKDLFKEGLGSIEEFDELSRDMIKYLSKLTMSGVGGDTIIEGISLDLWKDRVFHLIERNGLLPEYIEIENEIEEVEDTWYKDNPEFDFPESEPILTKIKR